jgi:hypothetical protein
MKKITIITIFMVFIASVSFEIIASTKAEAICWHVRNSSARECCTEPNC